MEGTLHQSKAHATASGMHLCDLYMVEPNLPTRSCASVAPSPDRQASIHRYMRCSLSRIVDGCTSASAFGIFSLSVLHEKSQLSRRYFLTEILRSELQFFSLDNLALAQNKRYISEPHHS